jgi:small subunit ribosomal protein S16
MLVIRLQRTGRENTPTFRIVVSEKTKSAKSGMQEIVGHFIPNRATPVFECKQDRIEYWISKGAQPSDTLARHLKRIGMKNMEKFIIKYAKQKSKSEVPAAAAPAAPAAAPAPVAEAPAAAPEAAKAA